MIKHITLIGMFLLKLRLTLSDFLFMIHQNADIFKLSVKVSSSVISPLLFSRS